MGLSSKDVTCIGTSVLNVRYRGKVRCRNRISNFGDISGTSSKFRTSSWITNICPIHTQLMQNYINIFRIGILSLTFWIHSLSQCKNLSIAPTFMTSQHSGFFPKCRLTFQEKSDMSKRHFKWGWGRRNDEGLKMKCRPTFKIL